MLTIIVLLAIIVAPVVTGNWYVVAYGDIDSTHASPISNFVECVAAGNPILESYPEQCRTAEGFLFTNEIYTSAPDSINVSPPADVLATADAEAAVAAVRAQAAKDLGVAEEVIDVTSIIQAEWPDGCLGLADSDQMCLMMITFGYEVTVATYSQTVVYRTDQTGAVVKKETYR